MDLITRLLESPLGKDIQRKAEEERIAERRKCRERIDEAESKYDVLIEGLDPKIEAAQRAITEFRRKFEGAREEANRLASEKRIGYVARDTVVSTQQDLLRESSDPAIQIAVDACWEKLKALKVESGESKSKVNLWGAVTQAFWSNAHSVSARKTAIRKAIDRLEKMKLEVNEKESEEVKRLLDSIPKDALESDYSEASYEPEARRLTKYPARSTRV